VEYGLPQSPNRCFAIASAISRTGESSSLDHAVQCLVPALDLALGLGMEGRATRMAHALRPDPLCQFAGDIAGSVVRQQARFVSDLGPGRSLMLPVPVPGCR